MTKEEAIKKLNVIKRYLTAGNPIWDVREVDEVLDIAIKALEELPKRRKEAKRWKRKALKEEPVKHGKWEDTKYINMRKCSCCQAEWGVFSNKYWNSIEDFNFCPNCGAKIDKE